MQLRWEMLEPTFARRAAAAVAASSAAASPSPPESRSGGDGRAPIREEIAAAAAALLSAVFLVGLYLSVVLHFSGAATGVVFSMLPMMLLALIAVPEVRGAVVPQQHQQQAQSAAKTAVLPDAHAAESLPRPRGRVPVRVLRRALAADAPGWSRAERLYGEVAALLLGLGDPEDAPLPPLEVRRRRDILRQCGALLTTAYRVERRRAAVRAALPAEADISSLDAELAALLARAEAEADPAARAALSEGAALCAERRESLTALGPLLARLDAQEEAVCQALLLARAALLHQRAAGTEGAVEASHLDAGPQIAALRQSVRQIVREARAAGDAATEIADLERRAGVAGPSSAGVMPPVVASNSDVRVGAGGAGAD